MKERVIPFLNYRYFAYALSAGLFIIFTIITIMQGGLRMGVDFVGGQKIIAKFEKGADEEKIRTALSAFNPLVQQIGEADLNEYIISTKISGELPSVIQEKIMDRLTNDFPGAALMKDRALLIFLGNAVNEGMVNAKLAGMDAVVSKIGDSGAGVIVYPRESLDKKKLNYNPESIAYTLRGSFDSLDLLKGFTILVTFGRPVDEREIKNIVKTFNASLFRTDYAAKQGYIIYKIAADESDRIRSELDKNFKKAEILSVENVGPAVGDYLKKSALKLAIVAIILMTIYLSYRFEFRYSVGAMVAVLHDLFLSVVFCGAAGVEISIPVIAALLTIFGYSVNDTIVIFDRIRENTQIESKSSFIEIVNKSITFTMSRTILTSFLTLLTVFALFLLGGEGITDFAMVLLFGMIVGIYSTVYIASPVVISWEKLMARIRS
ncbi:MAG: protein-export membrane protein SecF [Spirochaetes bacterium RBG_13_51_14]|nr:MAG: protein-export membrane protein SecF [Spirochaetes bacterium RBG_13_51_14]